MEAGEFLTKLLCEDNYSLREKLLREYNEKHPENPAPYSVIYLSNKLTEEDINRGIELAKILDI